MGRRKAPKKMAPRSEYPKTGDPARKDAEKNSDGFVPRPVVGADRRFAHIHRDAWMSEDPMDVTISRHLNPLAFAVLSRLCYAQLESSEFLVILDEDLVRAVMKFIAGHESSPSGAPAADTAGVQNSTVGDAAGVRAPSGAPAGFKPARARDSHGRFTSSPAQSSESLGDLLARLRGQLDVLETAMREASGVTR